MGEHSLLNKYIRFQNTRDVMKQGVEPPNSLRVTHTHFIEALSHHLRFKRHFSLFLDSRSNQIPAENYDNDHTLPVDSPKYRSRPSFTFITNPYSGSLFADRKAGRHLAFGHNG